MNKVVLMVFTVCFAQILFVQTNLANEEMSSESAVYTKYIAQAEKLIDAGDYEKAEWLLQQALILDPANAKAIGNLGVIDFFQGNLDQALQKLHKAEALENLSMKDREYLYNYLGHIYLQSGEIEKAIEYGMKSLAINDTDNLMAYLTLSTAHMMNHNFEEIIYYSEKVLKIQPDEKMTLMAIGQAYFYLGNKDKAKEYILKAKEVFLLEGEDQGAKMADDILGSFM